MIDNRIIDRATGDVPDYAAFLTVDELRESTRELATAHPDLAEVTTIGRSRNGDPIEMLSIGSGRLKALLFACPHPNEPVGAMTLEYLSRRLVADDELRESMDCTWHLVKCIDPDATRLNEGWFEGPFTPEHYARNYFRPPSYGQVEWTFPFHYKTVGFDRPLPETRALMDVITEHRPEFMMSLHNAGFGGAYFYISRPCPPLYPLLHRVVRQQRLPLHLGEPEIPYAEVFDRAIYRMIGRREGYDYLEENSDVDPAEVISGGTSSHDFAQEVAGTYTLVCEVPYYYDPRIDDATEADCTRREAVLEGIRIESEFQGRLESAYREVEPVLTRPSPFREAIEEAVEKGRAGIEAKESWARSDPGLDRPATRAEVFDSVARPRFYRLLILGMYLRLLRIERAFGGARPRTRRLELATAGAEEFFQQWHRATLSDLDCQVIPIQKLVRVQLGSALYTASAVADNLTEPADNK
ncbi:MAG: M14 family zinc carboxypeptidase [Bacillota bacterium]